MAVVVVAVDVVNLRADLGSAVVEDGTVVRSWHSNASLNVFSTRRILHICNCIGHTETVSHQCVSVDVFSYHEPLYHKLGIF